MSSNLIEVTKNNQANILTLNQPETLNAFSKEMITQFISVLNELEEQDDRKPLLITGKGRAFSSGGNLKVMKEYVDQNKSIDYIKSIVPYVNELIKLILNYTGPTLALLNGLAVGGGFNLAMACDFRIAHERAKFRMGFTDIGLTPATGNSFFLTKVLGIPKIMELILFSEIITAQNLFSWGLVNELYTNDNFEEIKEKWLTKLNSLDSWQVKTVRKLLYAGFTNSYEQQMEQEYTKIKEASERSLFAERTINRWNEIQLRK